MLGMEVKIIVDDMEMSGIRVDWVEMNRLARKGQTIIQYKGNVMPDNARIVYAVFTSIKDNRVYFVKID